MPEWIADRRLWVTGPPENPETRLVEEGDPAAAFLLVPKGHVVAAGYVARFDLPGSLDRLDGELADAKGADPSEDKPADPPAHKGAAPPRRRGRPRKGGDGV